MDSFYEMSGVDRSVTKIIFGDGIHNNDLMKQLNVENSYHLIFDRCHIMEVEWNKSSDVPGQPHLHMCARFFMPRRRSHTT